MPNGMNPIQMLMNLMNGGANPQTIMQNFVKNNPNINQMMTQAKNMANGQSMKDFAFQLAKQQGIDPKQFEQLAKKFGAK